MSDFIVIQEVTYVLGRVATAVVVMQTQAAVSIRRLLDDSDQASGALIAPDLADLDSIPTFCVVFHYLSSPERIAS